MKYSVSSLSSTYSSADVEPGAVPFRRFDAAGQEVFREYHDGLERRLRSEEFAGQPAFAAHLAKYRSLMPSLALLFALIANPKCSSVSERSARLAADWCDLLEQHGAKLYSKGGQMNALCAWPS